MRVTLSVDGPPPDRTQSGRSADRDSPHAEPLARAAEELMRRSPEAFPLREPLGITVVFGETKPTFATYDAIDPIIEVLVDVGLLADERLTDWHRGRWDPHGEGYTVTIEPAGTGESGPP
jgi:hypothetical protein